jgi:glucose-1-phosphate adenylyltransferase
MPILTLSRLQKIRTNVCPVPPISPIDMNRVVTLILGGGEGKRLSPLTTTRCKPAISFGGKYLLIDIPISNAINSGCNKIYVVTQFLSTTLHQHIYRTYRPGTFSQGFVELLAAEQGPQNRSWFQGTADAVRQNLGNFLETPADYILILSGDQLYNMNFQHMVHFAKKTDADVVIASLPVNETDAKRMGILKINEDQFVTEFYEKPQDKEVLKNLKLQPFAIKSLKDTSGNKRNQYLGSMGIYLFKKQALVNLLLTDSREDFGKHLIPNMVRQGKAAAYLYNGYWEDIGTIESFYKANIALTSPTPKFNCYDERNPIFSHHFNLPPPKIFNTRIENAIFCEGSITEAEEISNSILGPRTVIRHGTIIRDSYFMGNDSYTSPIGDAVASTNYEVGENCLIDKAIIDKHVSIGNHVVLKNKNKLTDYDSEHISISGGIIVVKRGARIPDGFSL